MSAGLGGIEPEYWQAAASFFGKRLHIWDWSGTIVQDSVQVFRANMAVLARNGIDTSTIGMYEWFHEPHGGNASFYLEPLTGKSVAELYGEYGSALNEIRRKSGPPHLCRGVLPLFQRLAPQRTGNIVISSHPSDNLQQEARYFGFPEQIHRIVGSVTNKAIVIEKECEAAGIDPKDAAYSGDMAGDVRAAKAAGVMAVAVGGGYHSQEALRAADPDLLVPSLQHLADWR